MTYSFRPATRSEAKPLIGLYSESGCGKTYSALMLARGFVGPAGKIGMIETESGRGEAYADILPGGYDVLPIRDSFSPENYGKALTAAEAAKLDALIIDSASHEWEGAGGVLGMAAANQADGKKGPIVWQRPKMDHQRHFMLRLMQTPIPLVIVCMRAKYPMIERKKPDGTKEWMRSETLEPKQADDILFEMFVHGWIDRDHRLHVTKYTRPDLAQIIRDNEPITIATGQRLAAWSRGSTAATQEDSASTKTAAADRPAPPAISPMQDGAGTFNASRRLFNSEPEETSTERFSRLDRELGEAAKLGTDKLKEAWDKLGKDDKKTLEMAKERRHKRTAIEVDAMDRS